MLAAEAARLHPVPAAPFTAAPGVTRRVDALSLVTFEGGQYSVPHQLAGQVVHVRRHGGPVVIAHAGPDGTAEVARHLATSPGSPRVVDAHYPPARPGALNREPKARTKAEAGFLAIGSGAGLWLAEAAAAGTPRVRGALRRSGGRAVVIGHASMAPALLCGMAVAWPLRGRFSSPQSGTLPFLLPTGLCFAIIAFPVLARVPTEENLIRTRIGGTAIAAAGIADITAWCLLALVVAAVRQSSAGAAGAALGLVAVFAVVMVTVVRPAVARLAAWAGRPGTGTSGAARRAALSASVVCLVLASGLATSAMGVHSIFGAFLAGLVMPRDNNLIKELTWRVEGVVLWVMLPLFFMTVGLQTNLASLPASSRLICLIIAAIAVAAKVGGTSAAAAGERPRTALALGAMMNCRGLTELIVLQLGLQLGVLDQSLFSIFVVMTLVTTAMTGPLLRWLLPSEERVVMAFGESLLDELESALRPPMPSGSPATPGGSGPAGLR
jgi:Kef-type K+ transport system membrane component KefB